ncbi:2-methoxy-6-polyprenyl-1,4-benzoquinol methylase, mitochondrial [Frankliniella fusca]|uniref:2-methoxy-6-polyprenyl-1,4-benzoquinol methylase, mitochondrial n=1 Tax=Frankliniella fusca TaxID=407009 RepID=A0AAE1HTV0_9NEOP|nr:2-methoxy-6-polyprenyl-1,4-benzoquinol methylase, mitochondrial [Frankliniella fusca]
MASPALGRLNCTVFINSLKFCGRRSFSTGTVRKSEKRNEKLSEYADGETHFGFEKVKEEEKSSKVHKVFEDVAQDYDKMNDCMSFGVHRLWKDIFMQHLSPVPGTSLLDVGGGTGDIAFRFIKYLKNSPSSSNTDLSSHVTISDINNEMLTVGKKRAAEGGIITAAEQVNCSVDWLEADAEKLPLPDSSYNAFTIAFCIRNCTHPEKVLAEAYRVLQPGGRFLCLEFSHVENDTLRWLYDQYSFQIIPIMGQLVAGQWRPYQYLVESIRQFPAQEEFKEMIEAAGFRCVTYENLSFGVVAIHSGFKL